MSLTKRVVFAFAISCLVTLAKASEIKCPVTHSANGKSWRLDAASVFEGKPADLVDLMPDLDTYEWDITPNQTGVQERGEHMYLVCRYKGTRKTVDLVIPQDATFCKVAGIRSGTRAWCTTPVRGTKNHVMRDSHGH